jgi:hypothetical protein
MGVTIYGVCAVTFMIVMYALERRSHLFIALFALGCVLSSVYGFLAGAWPFGIAEIIWSFVAIRRFQTCCRHVIAAAFSFTIRRSVSRDERVHGGFSLPTKTDPSRQSTGGSYAFEFREMARRERIGFARRENDIRLMMGHVVKFDGGIRTCILVDILYSELMQQRRAVCRSAQGHPRSPPNRNERPEPVSALRGATKMASTTRQLVQLTPTSRG